ncbi:MAG: type II toxin-antitoxin system Phd/YefM family antitoxin [Nakamurella sp.]
MLQRRERVSGSPSAGTWSEVYAQRLTAGRLGLAGRLGCRHLAEVRAGRTVTITDHGRPVARIVPVDAPNALERLIDEGRVEMARAMKRPAPTPIKTGSPVSDLIGDQRR